VTDNIAHDLKTPITRIRSAAEMSLTNGGHTDESGALAATTIEECDRLQKMINVILDISEAETGVMKLNLDLLDIAVLIEKVVDVYQYVAEEKNIMIQRNSPDGLHVKADRTRISQAIANLLDNAIKYTPEGHQIYIEASRKDG
jgi:signal transduction histidine kinase